MLTIAPARAAEPEIAVSGMLRVQGAVWDGLPFGPTSFIGDEDIVLLRGLGDVAVGWPGGPKALVEIGYHGQTGRRLGTLPTDASSVDLHLAYVDLPFAQDSFVRIGRQHFVAGKARFFGLRDGTNIRRSFDGITLDAKRRGLRIRAMALHPVANRPKPFDDSSDRGTTVLGVIATVATRPLHGLDLYLYDFGHERSFYAQSTGSERRYSFGARVFDDEPPFAWDLEAAAQRGHFQDKTISAWLVAGEVTYSFDRARWKPRLGLRANVTSGDSNPHDGKLGTFNAFFPLLYYLAQPAVIQPSNYADLQPRLTLDVTKSITVLARANWSWRMHQTDAIYLGGSFPTTSGPGGNFIARQLDLEVTYKVRKNFEIYFGYTRMDVGRALRDIGATDLNLFVLMTTNRF